MLKNEFLAKLNDVNKNYNTVYMWGSFGAPVTNAWINEKSNQYPSWYTPTRLNNLRNLVGKNYFAFDCVNLIKGILWGWNGDNTKYSGGAEYPGSLELQRQISEGTLIPDISADMLINKCNEVSTDFFNIETGEAVWMPGHIGVYIGKGKVIECTPAWDNGVQISSLNNNSNIERLPKNRTWEKHGKMPWIEYTYNKNKTWYDIIYAVSSDPSNWVTALNKINDNIIKADLEKLEIFQYFGLLIEKIYRLNYIGNLSWEDIISTASINNATDWIYAIDAVVAASNSIGDLGTAEIFKFIPNLLVKVYEIDK